MNAGITNVITFESRQSLCNDELATGWLIVELKWRNPSWRPKAIAAEVKRLKPAAKTTPRSVSSTLSVYRAELARKVRQAA